MKDQEKSKKAYFEKRHKDAVERIIKLLHHLCERKNLKYPLLVRLLLTELMSMMMYGEDVEAVTEFMEGFKKNVIDKKGEENE